MKRPLLLLFLAASLLCTYRASAQDDTYTYRSAAQKDRISLDGGLIFPFGDLSKGLDLSTAWGVNFNFWKFISDRSIAVVTVGNSWYQLGSEAPTDSTPVDLSEYSMNATPLLGGIGWVFGDDVLHPYVIIHGGATFITVNIGKNRPSEEINNEAYFTLAGTAGLGYAISERWTAMGSLRYTKMFDEDLQSISILFGISFRL